MCLYTCNWFFDNTFSIMLFSAFLLQQLCKQFLNSVLWVINGYVNSIILVIRKRWFWSYSATGRNPNQIKANLSEVEGNVQHTIDISVHLIWQIGEGYKKINSSFLNRKGKSQLSCSVWLFGWSLQMSVPKQLWIMDAEKLTTKQLPSNGNLS
jgi:hypothetical protein